MKDYFKILGFVLLSEVLCLFINLTLAFSSSVLIRIITAVCTVGILVGLMVQAGHSIGTADRKRLKQDENAVRASKPLFLGMTAAMPFLILWIFLLLARLGSIDGGFYRVYKLLCAPFLQVCNLICDDVYAQALPVFGMVVLALCSLVPYLAVVISYRMTLRGENVEKLMYE